MQLADLALRQSFAEALAREAGWPARSYFVDRDKLEIRMKGFQDFLTAADGAVEALLRRKIAEAFPQDGFIGEETGGTRAERLWIVDPIDGTANFARGEPHWCVSIGFLERGRPVFGVIEAPMLGETYSARVGCGALRNGTAIAVAETGEMSAATIEIGWSARRPVKTYLDLVEGVMKLGGAPKRSASGALGLCWAACGRSDGYLETHINSWDVAAGYVIATEAGAVVNNFFAGDAVETGNPILAATPRLAPALAGVMGLDAACLLESNRPC
jgi:myo-inositol-1(or 4)-monophosphatase